MKSKIIVLGVFFTAVFCIGCGPDNKKTAVTINHLLPQASDSLQFDTPVLKESINKEDLPVNEYLTEELNPIRENYKRVNAIKHWTSIDTIELSETTEGRTALFFLQNGQIEKIITRHYGETFQQLREYYLLNGQLSFVFEKSYTYNRPITYKVKAMHENHDTALFNFDDSEIMEERSYFKNGKLIHKIESGDCGAPFAAEYLIMEQKRILSDFKRLLKHVK